LCTRVDKGCGERERELILAAAIRVVGRDGYRETTVAAIVREARLPLETFQRYFIRRRECFLTAYDAAVAALLDGAQGVAANERSQAARVGAALRFVLWRLAAEPELARACLLELPRAGREALLHEHRALQRLAEVLGTPDAFSPADGELVGELLAGGVWEAIRATLLRGSPADLPGLLHELREWVMLGQRPALPDG